jgi:hypothetical protein
LSFSARAGKPSALRVVQKLPGDQSPGSFIWADTRDDFLLIQNSVINNGIKASTPDTMEMTV